MLPFSTASWRIKHPELLKLCRPGKTTKTLIQWKPLPGPQTLAYLSPADILFYGGAAGGGKTDLLLGLGLKAHHSGVIFRREYPQLKGIIERSRELVGLHGRYNGQENIWRLANGRLLEFGAVQYEYDVQKYQGRPHDFIGIDEITNFMQSQFRFLVTWLRTTRKGQRTRVVVTGNPPVSAEGVWVIEYFAPWLDKKHPRPALPGELRWYATIDKKDVELESGQPFMRNGEMIYPKSRTFIPAHLADNPHLTQNSNYLATLQALPEPIRSKFLKGDFSAGFEDHPFQVMTMELVSRCVSREFRREWKKEPFDLAIDVARYGDDMTAIGMAKGGFVFPPEGFAKQSTMDTAGRAAARLTEAREKGIRWRSIRVDDTGVGGGVTDRLEEQGFPVVPMNFGSSAFDSMRFADLATEMWWNLRTLCEQEAIALPDDRELIGQMTSRRYKFQSNGQIKLESKEEMRKRGLESPDKADMLAMLLYPDAWIQRVDVL